MSATLTAATLTGREYLRVSEQGSGDTSSTEEQHRDNQSAAAEQGWTLTGEPYIDLDRSASKYASRGREGYDQLIADLTADRFGADVLMLWESSRGSRRVSEWLLLLELLEERGILIHVTTHDRTYDPRIPRDRKSLLEDAVDSEYESGKTSLRVRRSAAKQAAEGKPNGRVPFGYRRTYEYVTVAGKQKRLIHQIPDDPSPGDPEGTVYTAPLVRELFDRLQRGHSLRSIEKDWAERGITNGSGTPYSAPHLRSIAINHAYAGQRAHHPGRRRGTNPDPSTAVFTKAIWEPLVDPNQFLAVHRMLSAPERLTRRPGRAVHLLSMTTRCDVCGGPLNVMFRRPDGEYTCRDGHVRISKPLLDEWVEDLMLAYLAQPSEYGKLLATEADDAALAAAHAEVERIQGELDDLADQVGSGALTATLAARAEPGIRARLKAAQEHEQELATPSRLRGLIEPGPGVEKRWKAAPISTRREVARLLLSPEVIGELRVTRRPPEAGPRRVPVAQRVVWRRESR